MEDTLIRVDKALANLFPQLTNRHIEEALKSKLVSHPTIARLKKGTYIERTSILDCSRLEGHLKANRINAQLNVGIVAEEKDWIVVEKPAGIHSHPISLLENQTITHWAFAKFPEIQIEFPDPQPTITPHRLDRDTSGLLIVARNKLGYQYWRSQFSTSVVLKTYLAWCWGNPEKDEISTSSPMDHDLGDRRKMTIQTEGKPAETTLKVITRRPNFFLANIIIKTGVTHQIRVHLSSLGFPLVGDELYDEHYSSRPIKVTGHQLQCIEIKGADYKYTLNKALPEPQASTS